MNKQEFNQRSTKEDKQLARAELRRAIDRAVDAGMGWSEIVRTLAELGPLEVPGSIRLPPAPRDSQ
jgi:hypothetical protein